MAATVSYTAGVAVREDTAIIHVTVTGVNFPDIFSWTSAEGGAVTSNSTFTRPGGMVPGVQLGGPAERSDLTVKRQYTSDLDPYLEALEAAAGSARMSVSWVPLGPDMNYNGNQHHITGILKEVQWPMFDANSNAAAFLTLVMACDALAGAATSLGGTPTVPGLG
jgi:hypothetical protein